MSNKLVGARGENLAAEFLSRHGFEIVERNFRYGHGEIDIIVRRGKLISFCEVKTRTGDTYGTGEEAVNSEKQDQIRKVAEGYIAERNLEDYEFRFDVVVVEIRRSETRIRVIENAF
ncbi:MAG TPA: YraN family protein [Candidatus Acidoferrales bacterium]|nr:YraN family protein [Candidatus Acidoferrales bacterium]